MTHTILVFKCIAHGSVLISSRPGVWPLITNPNGNYLLYTAKTVQTCHTKICLLCS
uniref:Uncharacterized protein n=1 Tax=Anguilla anguilla TaxID=7936 RepID=A0A0E9XQL3_ANGAN